MVQSLFRNLSTDLNNSWSVSRYIPPYSGKKEIILRYGILLKKLLSKIYKLFDSCNTIPGIYKWTSNSKNLSIIYYPYHCFSHLWCWNRLFDFITDLFFIYFIYLFSNLETSFLVCLFFILVHGQFVGVRVSWNSSFLNFSTVSTTCQFFYWFLFRINSPPLSLLHHWNLQYVVYVSFWLLLGENKAFTKAELWAYNHWKIWFIIISLKIRSVHGLFSVFRRLY